MDDIKVIQTEPVLSKNEYIALELTRSWALGLPNRRSLSMFDIIKAYEYGLKQLEKEQ